MLPTYKTKHWTILALGFATIASTVVPLLPQGATASAISLADPAFEKVWSRTDKPVDERMAARSWMWGPDAFSTRYEPYIEGAGGQHLVSYFDKARMEINDPSADRNSNWFVTNGLLVVDMIAGRVQTGNNSFQPTSPANIPVAGDAGASFNAPTYASLQKVASVNGDHRATNRTGQRISEGLGRDGNTGSVPNLASYARYGVYEPTTGHNIADIFWTFLTQDALVYENGRYNNARLVDWLFAMGYPITEPYWIQINVAGQDRWVLMQAFQRRILTYSPDNPAGWRVEMGNVGRAYYDWRYAQQPAPTPMPTAIPTPKPQAAAISINPTKGDTTTSITVSGKNFPAFAAVTIGAERPDANYFRNLAVAAAKGDGSFSTKVDLPDDAAKLGAVTITATANGGAVRAAATFALNYSPAIQAAPNEVVNNGVVNVQGEGFPARANIDLGAQFNGGGVDWLARVRSNDSGEFEANMPIGNRAINSSFKVIAASDGGYKATSKTTHTVLAQPGLQVVPGSGPAGVNVTLQGTHWPAFRGITLGTRSVDTAVTSWVPGQITADANGNFSIPVYIAPEYAGKSQVRVIAYEPVSTFRLEASYIINAPLPSPTPVAATLSVVPNVLAIGQTAMASGANWQASAIIQVGVGRPGMGVEEWLGSARAEGNRSFSMPFTLGPRWANAGQLIITAVIPGSKVAYAPVSVVPTAGRITPQGLPMTVNSFINKGTSQVRVNANGWKPGSVVHLSVVSADGTVNQEMGTAVANDEGVFSASFNEAVAWAGRSDLGIRAATLDAIQYSLRYLPTTTAAKQQGTSNTYVVTGFNWPANTQINVVVGTDDETKGEGGIVRTITTDPNGSFSFTVDVPRLPGNSKSDLELRAVNQPYSATFNF